jgi:fumarate reductase subunit C
MVQVVPAAERKELTAMPQYTTYQPKPYQPRMSAYWYLDQFHYLRYVLRESSSFFVAYFCVLTLVQIAALSDGPTYYAHFQAVMQCPLMIIINAAALGLILLHAVTWFLLVPRVALRQMLGRPTPDLIASVPNFMIWFGATVIVGLFILGIF